MGSVLLMVTRKTLSYKNDYVSHASLSSRPELLRTYRFALVRVDEAGPEALANLQRRTRDVVSSGNDAVVLGLEDELDHVTLLCLDVVRLELVIVSSLDANGLGVSKAGESRSSEDVLESRHDCGIGERTEVNRSARVRTKEE